MTLPSKVKIYEVGPRDGLQNEKQIVPVDVKVELVERLQKAGLKYIEAGAFVSPKWVPQMADSTEVFKKISRDPHTVYAALVPNMRGMEAALEVGVNEIAVFAAASEEFSQKNINCTIAESLERFTSVIESAKEHNIPVRSYVSCVVGCPYEGDVAPEKVADVSRKLLDMGCYEISLGDTIGVGTPEKVRTMLGAVMAAVPVGKLALHCHDTYGRALENIKAGLEMGIAVVDSSVAGLGGCPYAKGASGNVATEDVVYMLNELGIETGVNVDLLVETARFISGVLDSGMEAKI